MTDHDYQAKRRILRQFWTEQSAAYGRRWMQEDEAQPGRFDAWADRLSVFRVAELRDGVAAARQLTNPHPLSLPEFIGIIKANRKSYAPQNCPDDMARLEHQGRKLLAGKMEGGGNRIIKRDELYVHQVRRGDDWVDADWQRNHPDGILPGLGK